MSFTQSAFIRKNTPELREKLLNLGYELGNHRTDAPITSVCYGEINSFFDKESYPDEIDCGNNFDLFLAIATMRDDTSMNQYWVFDQDFEQHQKGDFVLVKFTRCSCYCHVSTVSELIEHFKYK